MARRKAHIVIVITLALLVTASPALAKPIVIKMGTVAPEGSPWHEVLVQMGQDWNRLSEGQVKLHIYPGGVLGDELDMVRKVRIGQLHAVAMSGVGTSHIEPGVSCLQIPMMFDSYEELDYVRDRIAPRLETLLERKGFIVLNWGDAGWIHFFTKKPASTPDDIRKMRLFVSAGDAETLDLYKAANFRPVPLAVTDILSSLQTGMIDAFDVPPLLALINQWFGLANYMVDVKWAPLIGTTMISKRAWRRIPEALRPSLIQAARVSRPDVVEIQTPLKNKVPPIVNGSGPADAAIDGIAEIQPRESARQDQTRQRRNLEVGCRVIAKSRKKSSRVVRAAPAEVQVCIKPLCPVYERAKSKKAFRLPGPPLQDHVA